MAMVVPDTDLTVFTLYCKKYENNTLIYIKNYVDLFCRLGAKFAIKRFSVLACFSLENVARVEFSSEPVQVFLEWVRREAAGIFFNTIMITMTWHDMTFGIFSSKVCFSIYTTIKLFKFNLNDSVNEVLLSIIFFSLCLRMDLSLLRKTWSNPANCSTTEYI